MTRDDLEPHQADVRETTIVSIKLLRPRYAFIRRDIHTVRGGNPQGSRSALIDFDGKFRWIQQVGGPYPSIDHMRVPGADTDEELHLHDITPLRGFFDSSWAIFYFREGLSEMHYAGKETWRGSVYDVVAGSRPPYKANDPHEIGPAGENVRIYIGEDNLIHRVVRKLDSEGTTTEEEDLDHVALNPKLTGEDFTFKPLPALANPEAPARATPGNAGGL